jgi:pyruvate kinase
MSKTVASLDDLEKSIAEASDIAKKAGICKAGDLIIVVNGVDKKTGSTDTMRIVTCK